MSALMSSSYACLFTSLDDLLGRVQCLEQNSPPAVPRVVETTDTSDMGPTWVSGADGSVQSGPTKWTRWGGEWARPILCDRAHWRYREAQSLLLPCVPEECVRAHPWAARKSTAFYGVKAFHRNLRLRLETPDWRLLYYEGNSMTDGEIERQRERFLRAPQLAMDIKCVLSEDLIMDSSGTVNVSLPVVAKVSAQHWWWRYLWAGVMNLSASSGPIPLLSPGKWR